MMCRASKSDNTDARYLPRGLRTCRGRGKEKLKIGQAPTPSVTAFRVGGNISWSLFYMNQGAPQLGGCRGGSEILGCCFTLPSVAASGQSTGPRLRQAPVLV